MGDLIKRTKYAKTLEKIAQHGADLFYTGKMAKQVRIYDNTSFSPLTVYSHKNSFNAFVLHWSTCNTRAGSRSVLIFVSYNLHQISNLLQRNLVPRPLFGFADKRSGYEINSKGKL